MKKTTWMTLAAALLFSASGAEAADAPKASSAPSAEMADAMKKMKDFATPGPEHKVLSDMVGKWTFTSKNWMSADATPEEGKGTSTFKMILGGRYLQHETKTKFMGAPFEAIGMTAFDKVKKKYVTTWIDTMSTGIMQGEGSFDTAASTLKDSGTYSCPMTQKDRPYRGEWKILDKNNMIYAMHGTVMDPTAPEFKTLELTFKRVK